MPFKSRLQGVAAALATQGLYIGTSSWKYNGWTGLIYDVQRYCYRGKFAESRFERDCLAEYAQVFKTVCVDAEFGHDTFVVLAGQSVATTAPIGATVIFRTKAQNSRGTTYSAEKTGVAQ